ncbi:hypothetical protein J437_LFUL003809 [Ladona fulva]|uniref:Uncharacterized protein n=1 Tax=Ladona fulva TaxID=123851 RepID=A0A8K0KEE5_LADFU|nr:hypothetical protein J437_LFUL003809 [Ladona fulva]
MAQDRLSALLSVERETLETTDFDDGIDQFATVKSRKINLLWTISTTMDVLNTLRLIRRDQKNRHLRVFSDMRIHKRHLRDTSNLFEASDMQLILKREDVIYVTKMFVNFCCEIR